MEKNAFDTMILKNIIMLQYILGIEVYESISTTNFDTLTELRTEVLKQLNKADKSEFNTLHLRIKLAYIEFRLENMIKNRIY